jgi:hypothetical protein
VHRSVVAMAALATALAACSSSPRPAAPAPATAPAAAASAAAPAQPAGARSLAGDWDVEISSAQQGVIASVMRLVARGDGYVGAMQPLLNTRGESVIPGASPTSVQVRSASVSGDQVTIVLNLEVDEGRITGIFRTPDRIDGSISSRYLSGRVTMRRR